MGSTNCHPCSNGVITDNVRQSDSTGFRTAMKYVRLPFYGDMAASKISGQDMIRYHSVVAQHVQTTTKELR